jgi:hypothetical protein
MRSTLRVLACGALVLTAPAGNAQSVVPQNTSTYLGNGQWAWTMFVTASPSVLKDISYVEYTLPPVPSNRVQKIDKIGDSRFPFAIKATALSAVFEVRVNVVFKNRRRYITKHMLKFEDSGCPSFKMEQEEYRSLPGDLEQEMYVHVGNIHDNWAKRGKGFAITVLPGMTPTAGGSAKLNESQFTKLYGSRTANRWTLRPHAIGDAIQFTYGGTAFVLKVANVIPQAGQRDSVALELCEKR